MKTTDKIPIKSYFLPALSNAYKRDRIQTTDDANILRADHRYFLIIHTNTTATTNLY